VPRFRPLRLYSEAAFACGGESVGLLGQLVSDRTRPPYQQNRTAIGEDRRADRQAACVGLARTRASHQVRRDLRPAAGAAPGGASPERGRGPWRRPAFVALEDHLDGELPRGRRCPPFLDARVGFGCGVLDQPPTAAEAAMTVRTATPARTATASSVTSSRDRVNASSSVASRMRRRVVRHVDQPAASGMQRSITLGPTEPVEVAPRSAARSSRSASRT
jgi:hypothetical protein